MPTPREMLENRRNFSSERAIMLLQTQFNHVSELKSLQILIVEQCRVQQEIIGTYLRGMGFNPEFSSSLSQAASRLNRYVYDICFMDLDMDSVNNVTPYMLIQYLHFLPSPPLIVAMSETNEWKVVAACLHFGVKIFRRKPLSQLEIVQIVLGAEQVDQRPATLPRFMPVTSLCEEPLNRPR